MSASKGAPESCRDRGFTIVELLIALFLAGVVAAAALAIYFAQHQQMISQNEPADVQSHIKVAALELTARIRMAGYNVPDGVLKMEGYNTNPDTIIVTFDSGDLVNVLVEHKMATSSAELNCDGHDLSGACDGDWLFIYDPDARTGEFFQTTRILYGSGCIRHDTMPLSRAYPAGSRVYKMNRFKYFIDCSDSLHPNLMLSAPGLGEQVYAEDITDLNIQYVLESGEIVDVFPSADMVREVIIRLDARADDELGSRSRTGELITRAKTRNLGIGRQNS